MSLNRNIISGGTVSDGYGDRPQHGSEASGGGASRSSFSNSPEPEVPRQASGEQKTTADPCPAPVAGQAGQDSNSIGHTRAPEPSSTSSGARKKNLKMRNKAQQLQDIYRLFGPQSHQWDRYLTVKFKNEDMNDLDFEKYIVRATGDQEIMFHTDKNDDKIIKTKDNATSLKLQELQELGKLPVEITPHCTLNSRRGTILCNHLRLKDTPFLSAGPSIKESLEVRGHRIEEVVTYEIPSRSRNSTLRLARVTFHTQSLPEKVTVGGVSLAVKEYIPKPMQCKNCWRYRHPSKYCKNQMSCVRCGHTGHSNSQCRRPVRCTNCGLSHHANSRECAHYKYHSTITVMWENLGLPFREAKQRIKEEGLFPDLTYAGAARNQQAHKVPNPQQHQQQSQQQQQQQQRQKYQQQQDSLHQTSEDSFHSVSDMGDRTIISAPSAVSSASRTSTVITDQVLTESSISSSEATVFVSPITTPSSKTPHKLKVPSDNFGETYLSMEDASESQCSEEGSPSRPQRRKNEGKHSKKRTKEAAFLAMHDGNPEAKRAALEQDHHTALMITSSPIKKANQRPQKSSNSEETHKESIHLSLLSQVITLDKTEAASKEKSKWKKSPKSCIDQNSDGQHTPADNCGCHNCISRLAIIKNEPVRSDRKFSKRFLDQVKKLKLHFHTSLTSHPHDCICKIHVEKINKSKSTPPQQPQIRLENPASAPSRVSNLRNQFEGKEEALKRPDPRTGYPPVTPKVPTNSPKKSHKQEGEESSMSQSSIPVLTSR